MLGGILPGTDRAVDARVAMAALAAGEVRAKPLITHRFAGTQVKEGYDFLYEHPDQALGLLFEW